MAHFSVLTRDLCVWHNERVQGEVEKRVLISLRRWPPG